jgi:predicted metallo-beta-lactamase superfamily hydrolase
MNKIKEKLQEFITRYLGLILFGITSGLFTFYVSTNVALAEHELKIKNIESTIEKLYRENREDHHELRIILENIRDKK